MSNKKKIILGVLVGILIGSIIGITYAIFSYSRTGGNEQLITGDIYMHYKESNTLTLENALPSSTYDSTKYFEFTIDGKNTNTLYDIYYDILLNRGDVPTSKQETNRILDRFLKFRLVEVINNEETEIFTNKSYSDLSSAKRIHVATIPKNTTSEITHRYRLYMWIGNEVVIGNTGNSGIDYDMTTWNTLFASIKVSSTGDFTEKYTTTPPQCFKTSDNGDNAVTVTGLVKDEYEVNQNMSEEELQVCIDYVTNTMHLSGDAREFCLGTGTYGSNFQQMINSRYLPNPDADITYLNNNNVIIESVAPDECKISDIIIPSTINNHNVTSIGTRAFSYNQLTSVEIPNSVTTIGNSAFSGNQLTSVDIPNSVTIIGNGAFFGNQLTSVEIPDSVTTIGASAFGTNQLTSVTIPNSVTTIENGAFQYNQLTSIVIPDSVTSTIHNETFQGNPLTSVTIGNGVTTIEDGAFLANLTSITIGSGITSIGSRAFGKDSSYNSNLSSITIDKSCSDIKNNLLSGSTNYYPWLSGTSPYTASGVTIYGSNNEVCDTF